MQRLIITIVIACLASPALGQVCGDGSVDGPGEECDDFNTDDGDGCSSTCTVETGWDCTGEPSTCTEICGDDLTVGSEACDDGNTVSCDDCSSDCRTVESDAAPVCGSGDLCGGEECDDGNIKEDDGCSSGCTVQSGWNCTGEPSRCKICRLWWRR